MLELFLAVQKDIYKNYGSDIKMKVLLSCHALSHP